ncbi:membrane protein insertase YidC [Reichenbachiella agarivorans]|uniref:Membrane protein insertase YidC n=1 Tax=Reichenbachiella agarivorans TaxID=2979464 RepID=A0ABY6CML7_9BACT|nr:membrane protein insertase YidC [Reichenbachiella agarivorans]UXP31722.1 membrane protein insertase YidC [Reichenbachiella agarivorans]
MDRKQIIGMVVMLALMTVYFQFFAPEPPVKPVVDETTATESAQVTTDTSAQNSVQELTAEQDSMVSAMQKERYGLFAGFANGSEENIVLENKDVVIAFSNKGATVKNVELKGYKTFEDQPLILLDKVSSHTEMILQSNYKPVNVSELYYTATQESKGDTSVIRYRVAFDANRYLEQVYSLPVSGFQVKYEINLVGLDGIVDNQDVKFNWKNDIKRYEKTFKESRSKTTVYYMPIGEGVDNIGSGDSEAETIASPIKWFTFKQKFFSSGLIADNQMSSAFYSMEANEEDTITIKHAIANVILPVGDLKTGKGKFTYYFGPNDYKITKQVTDGFEENVDLGWKLFRFVNKWLIIPVFNFLEQYISNYGIIIILLVFIIRLILAPLTYTSHMSMAKMKVLKPEMDAIKEKNDGDAQKTQQETMALYQKAGVNPLSGCIPMLLQFPFLLAMFNFFPNSIELRQESFLWAHDLSTYDSIWDLPFTIPFYGDHVSLFTLLMTLSTLAVTWTNSQMNTQMQGPMKTMQYMMPIMFLFFLNSYSAGLTFYYFVSNVVSFGQTALFRRLVDEDKIKLVMEENRKKNVNKKKSKFQQKLDEAMKASEEARKTKKKK